MTTFTLDELKDFWGITSNELIGQFVPKQEHTKSSMFVNLMGFNEKRKGFVLMHPVTLRRLTVLADLQKDKLKPYGYYRFTLRTGLGAELASIDLTKPIEDIDNPYQEIIKNQFYEYSAPKSDITVANLLGEISNRLYSSNDRVFYEIIQNADDMPTQRVDGSDSPVRVEIQNRETYTIIMYNSLPFNQQDVEAITSAAQSTKIYQQKKTGYKGIGFKSIFTETLKHVIIRSGGFQFKFDRDDPIFKDFEGMYLNDHPFQGDTSESRRKYLLAHEDRMDEFLEISNIPWQLKPLWVDFLDRELKESDFRKARHNVAIAIKRSSKDTKEFVKDLIQVCQDSRFLLYLRNLNEVSISGPTPIHLSSKRVLIRETATVRETRVSIQRNGRLEHDYCVWQTTVECSNESFKEAGLDLQYATERKAGHDRRIIVDSERNKRDIPDKLASFDEIQLYFAAPIENEGIGVEESYRKGRNASFIYTYLPMNDLRIRLPFRISADFVPSANREQIEGKNIWNHFVLYNIGYQLVKWIKYLTENERKGNYLSLLPKPLNTGDSTISAAEEWFNKGYRAALKETAFIRVASLDTECELVVLNEIILNDSKVLQLFDESFFYAFTGIDPQQRKLPATGLDTTVLKSRFFREEYNVQLYTDADLIQRLSVPEAVTVLKAKIEQIEGIDYETFLTTFNALVETVSDESKPFIDSIPFLRFTDKVHSWAEIVNQEDHILLDNRTAPLQSVLISLGFAASAIDIDLFPAIKETLQTADTYLRDVSLLYRRLSERCGKNQYNLQPKQKAALFSLFVGLKQVGDEKYIKLKLFSDDQGEPRELYKLLPRNIEGLPDWLAPYSIQESEFELLPPAARNALVKPTTLFSKLLCDLDVLADCTKQLDSRHVAEWVKQLQLWRAKDSVTPTVGWNELPWLYTNDTHRFKAASELRDHDALTNVPAQAVIESLTGWLFPHPDARPLIDQFGLELKLASLTTGITHTDTILSKADTRLLIQFLKEANEATFLKTWTISTTETGYQLCKLTNETVYAANESTRAFIEASGLRESFITVPTGLADTETLAALGAITGDALCKLLAEKQAVLPLASLLINWGDTRLYATYLQNLPDLVISSTATYTTDSAEVQVLKIAHDLPERDNSAAFQALLNKTTLDGQPLIECFSDMVRVESTTSKEAYEFLTAELLPNNANRIELIQKAIGAFRDCHKLVSEDFLRKKVFSAKALKPADAESEIFRVSPTYLTPVQVVFLQVRRLAQPQLPRIQTKDFFNHWLEQQQEAKAWAELGTYLNLLHEKGIFKSQIPLGLEHCVLDPDYCLKPDELLPDFYTKWADTEDKQTFLTEFNDGPKGPESDVVKLRNALLNSDDANANVCQRNLDNTLLINTLKWLCEQQNDEVVTACIGCIGEMLKKVSWPADQQPIVPIITSIETGVKTYRLSEFANQVVHTWSEDWQPYEADILRLLNSQRAWVVENSFPVALDKLIGKLDSISPVRKLASDIMEGSNQPTAPCYVKWELTDSYPIHVIRGNRIPWQVWYGEQLVIDEEDGEGYFDEGTNTTYLTAKAAKSFPLNLPANFPESPKNALYELALQSREQPEEEPTPQRKFYTPQFERIIGGDELNNERQGKEFKEAILRGIPFLTEQGFDFKNCDVSVGLHFLGVKRAGDDIPYNVTFRGAKRGLLYLNLGAWKRLGIDNEVLVVVYQGGEMRLFESKEQLLAEKWNDYMLYRIEKPSTIDANYKGITLDEKTTHLLFVTNEMMHQSLYQDKLSQKTNKPIDSPVSDKSDL